MKEDNKELNKGIIISTIIIAVLLLTIIFSAFELVSIKSVAERKAMGIIEANEINKKKVTSNSVSINTTKNETSNEVKNEITNETNETNELNEVGNYVTSNNEPETMVEQIQNNKLSLGDEITGGDLMMFTDKLNRPEYNCFIAHQTYSSIEKIDIAKVFYDGAGFVGSYEAAKNEYKEITGEETESDIIKVDVNYANDLLQKRTGVTLDWKSSMRGYEFSETYNAYYAKRSDTNYFKIQVTKGYVKDGVYTLIYKGVYEDSTKGAVTIQKTEDGDYKFISNYFN